MYKKGEHIHFMQYLTLMAKQISTSQRRGIVNIVSINKKDYYGERDYLSKKTN